MLIRDYIVYSIYDYGQKMLLAYSGQTARPFRRNGVPIPKQTA